MPAKKKRTPRRPAPKKPEPVAALPPPKPEAAAESTETAHERDIRAAEIRGRAEGVEIGARNERSKLVDAIMARVSFYEMARMAPATMTISWHEALVLRDTLKDTGFGSSGQLAVRKQWRVREDGNGNMLASHE